MSTCVESRIIKEVLVEIFMKSGLEQEKALLVAENLVFAEMRNTRSHGLVQTSNYSQKMRNGKINIKPQIKTIAENSVTLAMDADFAPGAVAGVYAMDLTIAKAKENGIAMTTVKNGTHYGVSAYYALRAVKEDMIGLAFTNSIRLMAPFGGYERELGTNPICIAVPAKSHKPVVYDGATSIAAYNKIFFANVNGKSIPEDWALDHKGNKTTNPKDVVETGGAVLPFGGYKGYGLATMVNIMTGLLSGGCTDYDDKENLREDVDATAYSFMVIDIGKFTNVEEFKQIMDLFIDRLKNSAKRENVKEILVPGEPEDVAYEQSENEGIYIEDGVFESILKTMNELGIDDSKLKNI